jgi:hypothetical protein
MNFVGKLFVMLTFAGSLVFLALAIGVYSNHVEWKGKDPKAAPGIVDRAQQKIDKLAYSRDRALARYAQAYSEVGKLEPERALRKLFYQAKFDMLSTGKDDKGNPVATPVQALEFDKQGVVQVRLIGGPATNLEFRGGPLLTLELVNQQRVAADKRILEEVAKIEAFQTELEALTVAMQGGPNTVGLIKEKEIQVDARKRAVEQQEFLKPTLTNRYSEAVLLLKREAGLRKRLEQVEKSGTTVGLDR